MPEPLPKANAKSVGIASERKETAWRMADGSAGAAGLVACPELCAQGRPMAPALRVRTREKSAAGTLWSIDDTPCDLDICCLRAPKGEH